MLSVVPDTDQAYFAMQRNLNAGRLCLGIAGWHLWLGLQSGPEVHRIDVWRDLQRNEFRSSEAWVEARILSPYEKQVRVDHISSRHLGNRRPLSVNPGHNLLLHVIRSMPPRPPRHSRA